MLWLGPSEDDFMARLVGMYTIAWIISKFVSYLLE